MLNKYLEQKQDLLDKMQQTQQRLSHQVDLEEQRLDALRQHREGLARANEMQCSLSLQNLTNMKTIIQGIEQQQAQRHLLAQNDLHRQQESCRKQAAFNLGIEQVIEKKRLQLEQKKLREQQKREDEIASQFVLRNL